MLPLILALLACAPARAEWLTKLADAQAASHKASQPMLLDFQAPWCYSCYYMEQHVLSKPKFQAQAEDVIKLKLDVDTPEGAELKAKYRVIALPSYVLLSPDGKELGRILGEQTEDDFLAKLGGLLKGRQADVDRHDVYQRIRKGDLKALRGLLAAAPPDCQTPYPIAYGADPVSAAPAALKAELLGEERAVLETLAREKLFVPADARCADFRSGVEWLAWVYEKSGDKKAHDAVLDRAIAQLRADGTAVGEDRNRDDNLRLFLDMRGDEEGLRAHYAALIEAYPSDYVYTYRWAKHLFEHGRAAEALPWIEKADKLCYGANRLMVTDVRARILAALGRKAEAKALVERDLRAARGRYDYELGALKKLRAELAKAR